MLNEGQGSYFTWIHILDKKGIMDTPKYALLFLILALFCVPFEFYIISGATNGPNWTRRQGSTISTRSTTPRTTTTTTMMLPGTYC